MWEICFKVSVSVLLGAVFFILIRKITHRFRNLRPFQVLFGGTFLASMILFLPIYTERFTDPGSNWLKIVFLSIHNTIRLFVVDTDFDSIFLLEETLTPMLYRGYSSLAVILYILAPVLTCGFILSFFKDISAYYHMFMHYKRDTYVFSELSEKSIALAESIYRSSRKNTFVFCDVFEVNEERNYELREQAQAIGAICMKHDISVVNMKYHSEKAKLSFMFIGDDELENLRQAMLIIPKYNKRKNTRAYVFSTSIKSELMLNSIEWKNMKVFRIDEVQSLISRTLYDTGAQLFLDAVNTGSQKEISAVIVGMGRYGTAMTKALSWFCQMDGYKIKIDVYDKEKDVKEKFTRICPELMADKFNGKHIEGEAEYHIQIHGGFNVENESFFKEIGTLKLPTYILVCLGNDRRNIEYAVQLRSFFAARDIYPRIQAVVWGMKNGDSLKYAKNFKGQQYDIELIGSLQSSYSSSAIINSEIEQEALDRHLKWGDEQAFWSYEYNYKSSVASVIHKKMKMICGIPGADKAVENRTNEEKQKMRVLEHKRWNAYMRSEGYTYAEKRNDLAKTHPMLVPFDELPEIERMKDDD